MSAMTNVRDYIESLPGDARFIGETAVKEMRGKGCTWEWLETALNIKSKDEWAQYGFGLFFTDSFQAQVQKKLQQKKAQGNNSIWIEEKPEPNQAPAFTQTYGKYELIQYGSRTYELKARTVPNAKLGEMTEDQFAAMVIEQNRSTALYCARYFPGGGFGKVEDLLEQYEIEDRSGASDTEIAKKYLPHR